MARGSLTSTTTFVAGARATEASVEATIPPAAEVLVRLRLSPAAGGLPLSDTLRFSPAGSSSRLFRRGPTTGRSFVAVGEPRFRRAEHARVAVPLASASASVEAALLDRAGAVLPIPVAARVDTIDGGPWALAEVSLAPLSAGDDVLRLVVGGDDAVGRADAASHRQLTGMLTSSRAAEWQDDMAAMPPEKGLAAFAG